MLVHHHPLRFNRFIEDQKIKSLHKGGPPMEASYWTFLIIPLHFPLQIGWGLSWDNNSTFSYK